MGFSVGIVGFPNVGKSTLFQTITKKQVACDNYLFCTIDPNIGIVSVFDERVERIFKIANSGKRTHPTIEFIDIAGLVEGANKGEGLGNKFLANIRETDVVVYVLRIFQDSNVASVLREIDPLRENELLDTELVLKDLETIEKRIEALEKEVRTLKKEVIFELEVLKKSRDLLKKGKILLEENFTEKEKNIIDSYRFLTAKPRLYLLNGKEEEIDEKVFQFFKEKNFLIIDLAQECEFAGFSREERISLGLSEESGTKDLIKKCYDLLGYITFFTVNSEETRAWKIKKGTKVPEAGGVVHSDFEKGFIKAEVVNWQDFVKAGGFSEVRKKGMMRIEGKEYVVQDGDIIEIKFKK